MALTLGQKILSQAGYTVVVAQSGFDALDLFRENPRRFDLVLLDLTMPFMDGEDRGGVDLVKRFVERFKINYPIVIADEKMMRDFGNVEAVPTTFLIDRNGRVAGKHVGFAEKETLEREIKSLL